MKPMFLPGVEQGAKPSQYLDAVRQMQPAGNEYPQIWHLFAFAPHATQHLAPPPYAERWRRSYT